MSASLKTHILPGQVVGTIPSLNALAVAKRLKSGAVDFFELRVDHFAEDPAPLLRAIPQLKAPVVVTVRHPAEGGHGALTVVRRRELYAQFTPHAAAIDVEVRSLSQLASTVNDAHAAGVRVIASAHFFQNTPPVSRMRELLERSQQAGADIFKLATTTRTLVEIHRLLGFLLEHPHMPMSLMGMGPLGKPVRLLLASTGSVLNYGYLDAVQVPGQWRANELKQRLAEL